MSIFPKINPQKIDFNFPSLLTQKENFPTGFEHTFLNSQNGWGFIFDFKFRYLDINQLKTIIEFYKSQRGEWKTFSIPHEIWKHPLSIRAQLEPLLKNCAFRFNQKPKINSLNNNVYDLSFELITDLDFDQPWIHPPTDPINRVNIIIQDNVPSFLDYWDVQYNKYKQLRKDLEEKLEEEYEDEYKVYLYFLSTSERHLKYLFTLPPNYQKQINILITANSESYTGNQNFAYQDKKILEETVSKLKKLNGNTYLVNHLYFLNYPDNLDDPILKDVNELSSSLYSVGRISDQMDSITYIDAKIKENYDNHNPDWDGNRDWMFQDIINKLTP